MSLSSVCIATAFVPKYEFGEQTDVPKVELGEQRVNKSPNSGMSKMFPVWVMLRINLLRDLSGGDDTILVMPLSLYQAIYIHKSSPKTFADDKGECQSPVYLSITLQSPFIA